MKIIDGRLRPPFHSIGAGRLFDPGYAEPLCAKFGRNYPNSAKEKSMQMVLQEMEAENIICGLTPIRRSQGRGMKNEDFTLLNEQYPGKFIGFAGLDPTIGIQETLNEIEQYVTNGSFTGVNFEPGLDPAPWYLDKEVYFPIYEKCEKDNIPVYVTWGGLCATPEIYEPQIIENVAKSFPKLRMFLGHAGFPRSAEHCVLAINHPNIYLGIDLYIINSPAAQDFIVAGNYACKNQICFGSAYPLNLLNEAVDSYKKRFHKDVWENIFYNNSAKFVGIE